ncbi:MAG: hypothetical protein M3542_09930 [Acidobacteriota bacterium]|nr:hypothetical protein [Acidobacteriota bacterium]
MSETAVPLKFISALAEHVWGDAKAVADPNPHQPDSPTTMHIENDITVRTEEGRESDFDSKLGVYTIKGGSTFTARDGMVVAGNGAFSSETHRFILEVRNGSLLRVDVFPGQTTEIVIDAWGR